MFAPTADRWSNAFANAVADIFADAFANAVADVFAGGKRDAVADVFVGGNRDAVADVFVGGKRDAVAASKCDTLSQSNGRRRRSYTCRRSDNRHYCGWAYGWLLLHDEENVTTQRGQNKFVEVNKSDIYNRILELDFQKMEKRRERHIWHIKSMWGGMAGILLAVYVVLTSQYLYGNAVLVRGDNYILAGGTVLISIALCYGLMWIGVIREYRKFEDVIDERIRYYEDLINAPQSAQLSGD